MQSHWHYAPPTVDNSAQSVGRVAKARMAMSALAWDSGFPREFAGHNQSVNDVLNLFRQRRHNFTVESPTRFLTSAVILCDVLGALCLILNLFVISALIRNRKRVLKNVFYVIVLHCAIVDLIRGSCLIAWGMPHLLLRNMGRVEDRLLGLKLNQFTLVVLRSCNLLTIFNLLVFTTNEFIVIRHPLHYRRYFRRRTVLLILLTSWVVSVTFGMGSVFTNFPASAHSVLVRTSDQNGTLVYDIGPISAENGTDDGVTRRELDGVSVNMVSMLMIFALCYACLATVLICYGIILRTIRQFHAVDNNKGAFHSEDSQRVNQRSLQHRESRRESHATDAVTGTKRCNSHRRWRIHLMSRHKYLIVIGSVLFVDVLFLLPYSAIQMVAFLHLNNFLSSSSSSTLIRWSLQIIIGVHSVCQPLCYFRMNEFRRLACGQRRNSQSFSQWHKSFAQTKDQPNADNEDGQEEEKCDSPQPDDALLSDEVQCGSAVESPKLLCKDTTRSRQNSFKFRTYGTRESPAIRHKLSELTGLHSSTHFEPEPESNV